MEYENEEAMYPDIIESIKHYMKFYGYTYDIFETWHEFNPNLSKKYQKEIDILGTIGKPDLMVIYNDKNSIEKTLIIEVKKENITLINIAQAKMYGDIFNTDKVFLVGPYELRRQIKQYFDVNRNIFRFSENRTIKYVQFKDKKLLLQNAFPEGGDIL